MNDFEMAVSSGVIGASQTELVMTNIKQFFVQQMNFREIRVQDQLVASNNTTKVLAEMRELYRQVTETKQQSKDVSKPKAPPYSSTKPHWRLFVGYLLGYLCDTTNASGTVRFCDFVKRSDRTMYLAVSTIWIRLLPLFDKIHPKLVHKSRTTLANAVITDIQDYPHIDAPEYRKLFPIVKFKRQTKKSKVLDTVLLLPLAPLVSQMAEEQKMQELTQVTVSFDTEVSDAGEIETKDKLLKTALGTNLASISYDQDSVNSNFWAQSLCQEKMQSEAFQEGVRFVFERLWPNVPIPLPQHIGLWGKRSEFAVQSFAEIHASPDEDDEEEEKDDDEEEEEEEQESEEEEEEAPVSNKRKKPSVTLPSTAGGKKPVKAPRSEPAGGFPSRADIDERLVDSDSDSEDHCRNITRPRV